MSRSRLGIFTEFADTLLPHETAWLLSVQEFHDPVRLDILRRVDLNCRHIHQFTPYDEQYDKRKYSNLKGWIQSKLETIDVDEQFLWMSRMEQHIMTDALLPEDERTLIRAVKNFRKPFFFFAKFYELIRDYRHFLLVRMRYASHELVSDFLSHYAADYRRSLEVNEQIHRATLDVVRQYSGKAAESIQWEGWLSDIFYDEELDGLNRYMALVRLTFVYLNYRRFDRLLPKFDHLDGLFRQGIYYSKRLLLNYYGNRLLLHSKIREFDRAEYYGHLSVRGKNNDYLHYVNNLAAVLLRQRKDKEALEVMRQALPEMKVAQSQFNRIGFVAFYVRSLARNRQFRSAENYAESFLRAYRKEVHEYRWHAFFAAYLEVLLHQRQYDKILRVSAQNNLLERDEAYRMKSISLPDISLYHAVAMHKEGRLDGDDLKALLVTLAEPLVKEEEQRHHLADAFSQVRAHIPDIVHHVEREFHSRGILLSSH